MAKQLLGKEVTAALNEKIKANVAELQGKGVNPTLCIIRVGENPSDISYVILLRSLGASSVYHIAMQGR